MATLRELRSRIKSVKSTQQVTKAMKMVAAAKLRKSQDAVLQARPYANKLKELLGNLVSNSAASSLPLLAKRAKVKNILVMVIAADRGLCGGFNANVLKRAFQFITVENEALYKTGNIKLITVGRRSVEFFAKRGFKAEKQYSGIFAKLSYEQAKEIADAASDLYLSGEVDQVVVINNEFKSMLSSNLKTDVLLPITAEKSSNASPNQTLDYIYEPNSEELLNALAPRYLSTQVLKALLESSAAEQAARMMAMDSATDNAKQLIHTLSVSYNRARQASITKELIEIVSGANALQEG